MEGQKNIAAYFAIMMNQIRLSAPVSTGNDANIYVIHVLFF